MKRDPLKASVLATKLIPNVSPGMAKELNLTPEQARQQIDTVLTYQELEYIHQMEHEEGQVLFPVNEILLSICAKLNATEMLFCTIYMTGDYPSTWWGNYGGEYVVFTEKEA